MIRISGITLREIRLPLVEPFRTAKGSVADRRIILVGISGPGDTTTWSECVAGAAAGYSAETVESAWACLVDLIIPNILSVEFEDPTELHAVLLKEAEQHPMARAAVEMGSWAVTASSEGRSLASLLGESSVVTSAPRTSVGAGIVIGVIPDRDELTRRAQQAIADGYQRIKLKISPDSDIDAIRHVSELAGKLLAVDANGSFSFDNESHIRTLRELDGLGMSMIEQPLAADAMAEHGELQRILKTPICLDESIADVSSAQAMISNGCGRMINLKPARVGGFTEAIAIHDLCAHAGIPVWCGGMLESGIGRAYNVALASLPNFTIPGDLSPSARYWQRDIVTPPWTMSADGFLRVPLDQDGTGVEVDMEFIDGITVSEMRIME